MPDLSPGSRRPEFRKQRREAPPGFYHAEADGLRWLAEAVPDGGVCVVEVLQVDESGIVLERVPTVGATPAAAAEFGHRLALTHARGADWFGQPPPTSTRPTSTRPAERGPGRRHGYIGPLPLPLVEHPPTATTAWGAFYAEQRVLPYLRDACRHRSVEPQDAQAIEAVCARLVDGDDLAGPPEPVARIHGDLWSGNVLWSPGGAVLIDPAAHGGHRETDLAMLDLFGLPHLGRVLSAYHETRPPADGWRDRIGLHQLHPLLVHAVLFGGGYGRQAGAIAARYAGRGGRRH